MEVVLRTEDHRLVLGDALDLVTPLAGDLEAGLDRLRTGVHGEDHVEPKVLGDHFGELGEDIVIERARAKRQARGLVDERSDQLGVAMALVDCGVCGEEVEVVAALGVPDGRSLGAGEDDGERMVVVSSKILLSLDSLRGGGGVVCRRSAVCTVGRHGG